jgi:hypothetical protein
MAAAVRIRWLRRSCIERKESFGLP